MAMAVSRCPRQACELQSARETPPRHKVLHNLDRSAQGQTDLNPTSAIGKLSQVVFAVISPGRVVANIVAGAIAEAGAQQAGDMMQVVARSPGPGPLLSLTSFSSDTPRT